MKRIPKSDFKYKHLMVDLETLGLRSTSVILSIGAVMFNIETGEASKQDFDRFHCVIDIDDSLNHGLTIDAITLRWWLNKSKEAKESLNGNTNLAMALYNFDQFLYRTQYETISALKIAHFDYRDEVIVWGNSAKFDLGILANAYNVCGKDKPWRDKNERDVRTLASLRPDIKKECKFEGTKHNPIDDCLHQIKYCSEIWNKIH